MASKFLPFLKDGADVIVVYKAVLKRFPQQTKAVIAAITYVITIKGITAVQNHLSSCRVIDTGNNIIISISDGFTCYRDIDLTELDVFLGMADFIKFDDKHKWNVQVAGMSMLDAVTVIYIKYLHNTMPIEVYPGFADIVSDIAVRQCLVNIKKFTNFSEKGKRMHFMTHNHIKHYILYNAFIRAGAPAPSVYPYFDEITGGSDVPF